MTLYQPCVAFLRTWVWELIAATLHTRTPAVLQRPHALLLRLHRAEGLGTAPALHQAGRGHLALDARDERHHRLGAGGQQQQRVIGGDLWAPSCCLGDGVGVTVNCEGKRLPWPSCS